MPDDHATHPPSMRPATERTVIEETDQRVPPLPLPAVQVRWSGVLLTVAFFALVALVARTFGPIAAAVMTVAALCAVVISAALRRYRRGVAVRMGDGGVEFVWADAGDWAAGCDFGGGGGGGDC